MKKVFRKILIMMAALLIAVPLMTSGVSAESTVDVTGPDTVAGGEVFTVTVTFDDESIGRVVGDVTYDTSILSYISGGSSTGNVGYVELRKAGTGEPLTFKLEFQAIREGDTQIDVSASEMYDLGDNYLDTPSASMDLTVTGDAAEEEIVEETTEPDEAADEMEGVDEKPSGDGAAEEDGATSANNTLTKGILIGIVTLVLILLVALVLRRKK